jgi:transposase InsO family protein
MRRYTGLPKAEPGMESFSLSLDDRDVGPFDLSARLRGFIGHDMSKAWRRVCRLTALRHRRTRPYHPQTNGKAERWIQTVLRECLYLEVFNDGDQRRAGLDQFVRWYNLHRPHRAHNGLPPSARLAQLQAA